MKHKRAIIDELQHQVGRQKARIDELNDQLARYQLRHDESADAALLESTREQLRVCEGERASAELMRRELSNRLAEMHEKLRTDDSMADKRELGDLRAKVARMEDERRDLLRIADELDTDVALLRNAFRNSD